MTRPGELPTVDAGAVAHGAIVGAGVIVPVTIIGAALDRSLDDFDDTAWPFLLFLMILAAYAVAGWVAGQAAGRGPLTNGALAGLAAFATWVPLRVLVWAIRDDSKGLFSGDDPVFTAGGLLANLVFAGALGMVGGVLAGRRAAREPPRFRG